MTPLRPDIREYYERGDEAGRLDKGVGLLERARCQQIIARYLPDPPAKVLDVGGGPGFYSGWLARLGYDVHLIDPVPLHLVQARTVSANQPNHPIARITLGDARELDIEHSAVDVVLLCGPLYHLVEAQDRVKALGEARRVLKPGGVVLAVGITRYASLIVGLLRGWMDDPVYVDMVKQEMEQGLHLTPESWPSLFTTAHFSTPEEIAREIGHAGLVHRETLAVQGPAWTVPDIDTWWSDDTKRQALLDLAQHMEHDPLSLALGPHMIAVAYRALG